MMGTFYALGHVLGLSVSSHKLAVSSWPFLPPLTAATFSYGTEAKAEGGLALSLQSL